MTSYVLDCCTLINLHCGWGGLHPLCDFAQPFYMGQRAASEALFVRDFDLDGAVVEHKLAISHIRSQFRLQILKLSGTSDDDLMVKLARQLDDGEAEGLALAHIHGHSFCSDDKPVAEAARAAGLACQVISTPVLLQRWVNASPERGAALPSIIQRISTLGRFMPPRSSPHRAWWEEKLSQG